MTRGVRAARRLVLGVAVGMAGACRPNMVEQPRFDPYEPTAFFENGTSARVPPQGTVPRGTAATPAAIVTGLDDEGTALATFPLPITAELLTRGQERYDIYCSPCHGLTGDGDGIVVQRGFRPPPAIAEARLVEAQPGHFVDVMTRGLGAMPPYRSFVEPSDRWAIAAYLRALQRAVVTDPERLPPDLRSRVLSSPGAR